MLNCYQCDSAGQLQVQKEIVQKSWVSLIAPTEKEIQIVSNQIAIPMEFIDASLDSNERSRVQKKEDHLLIIANVPFATNDETSMPYKTIPISIIQTPEMMVTICAVEHPILRAFSEQQTKGLLTQKPNTFTLQLFQEILSNYINCLNDIDQKVAATEEKLKRSIHNEQIFTLLNYNKSLIAFTKSLNANHKAIEKLTKDKNFKIGKEDESLVLDIFIEAKQAIDTSRIHNLNLSGLMDAYSAAIENNLSIVVQQLTIYVIIIAIPMGAAGIFGMNTPLPFQDEPYMLTVIMSICLVISLLVGWILYRRRIF